MQIVLLIGAAIILACSAALAQSPVTFSQSGLLKLESLSLNGTRQDFIFGAADMAVRFRVSDQFKIGGDLGVDSLQLDGQRGGSVFATGVIEGAYGKLSVGIPRLVMPQVFDVPAIGGSEVLGVVQGLASGELLRFMSYFSAAPTMRGLRYDAQFDKILVAASVQELGSKDRMIHAIAATNDLGDYKFSLGRADVDLGPCIATTTKIALRVQKGRISGGVVGSHQNLMGSWENTVNGFVAYAVNDHLTVEGQVFDMITPSDSYLAWGADVIYRLKSGLFVQAGVAQLNPSADRLVTLSLGFAY